MKSNYAIVPAPMTVQLERLLPGPIGRVWEYLTDPDKRATWFAGGPMELRVGGEAQLHFDHRNITDEPLPEAFKEMADGGFVSIGHVTRCEPPHKLSYTWWEDDDDKSEISFTLTEKGDEVLLDITHRRLRDRANMVNVSGGWHLHLDILEDRLRGVNPRPFWSTYHVLKEEYGKLIPPQE